MPTPADHQATWDEHYAAKPQVWSGKVNTQLAEIASSLPAGSALDLGCGEGADAIWLAEHRWTVVGVDVSPTALQRARAHARARGVAERIDFQHHDLTRGFPEGAFDLVSAHFLHSTLEIDRPAILRRAAAAVVPGGSLLIVDHAAAPPWATKMADREFPSAEDVLTGLGLDDRWSRVRVGAIDRTARGPDGDEVTLQDNVMWLRREPD